MKQLINVHTEYDKNLRKEIFQRASFMNNTKWKYLFEKLGSLKKIYCVQFKFLVGGRMTDYIIPTRKENYFSSIIQELMVYGSNELKEIEYIFIPHQIIHKKIYRYLDPKIETQEIDVLVQLLETIAKKIEYERTEKGVFIYGYR